MAWYHWITTYTIIIVGFLFIVIPEKSFLFVLTLIGIGLLAAVITVMLPGKEDPDLLAHRRKYPEQYKNNILFPVDPKYFEEENSKDIEEPPKK